jgi:hypothetical protein
MVQHIHHYVNGSRTSGVESFTRFGNTCSCRHKNGTLSQSSVIIVMLSMIVIIVSCVQLCIVSVGATETGASDARGDDGSPYDNTIPTPTGGAMIINGTSGSMHATTGNGHGNGAKTNGIESINSFDVYFYSSGTTYYITCYSGYSCITPSSVGYIDCSTSSYTSSYTECYADFVIEAGSGWYVTAYVSDAIGTTRHETNWGSQIGEEYAYLTSSRVRSLLSNSYSCATSSIIRYLYIRVYCFSYYCTPSISFATQWAINSCGMEWLTSSSCNNCINTTTADCYYSEESAYAPDDDICSDAIGDSPAGTYDCTDGLQWITDDWSSCSCSGTQTRTITCENEDACSISSSYCSYDDDLSQPLTQQSCAISGEWTSGSWSTCSCNGVQTRTVSCYSSTCSRTVSSCSGSQPTTQQSCSIPSSCTPSSSTGTELSSSTGTDLSSSSSTGTPSTDLSSFTIYYYSGETLYSKVCDSSSSCITPSSVGYLDCTSSNYSSSYTECYADFIIEACSGWYVATYVADSGGTTRHHTNWASQNGNGYAYLSDLSLNEPGSYSYASSCATSSVIRYLYLRVYCFASQCSPTISFETFWATITCGIQWVTSSSCNNCVNTTTADCYYSEVLAYAPDDSICTSAIGASPATTGYCTNGLQWITDVWASCGCDGTQTRTITCESADQCSLSSSYCVSLPQPLTQQSCSIPSSCSSSSSTTAMVIAIPIGAALLIMGTIVAVVRYKRPPPRSSSTPKPPAAAGGAATTIMSPTSIVPTGAGSPQQRNLPSGSSITITSPHEPPPRYYINTMAAGSGVYYGAPHDTPMTSAPPPFPPSPQVMPCHACCSINTKS